MTKLNVNILKEAGYYGHVISKRMPKDLDNRLYTMIHLIGGFTTRDVMFFLDQATEGELKELHRLVKIFPSMMQDLLPLAGSYRMLVQTEIYQDIIDIIKFNEEKTELTENTSPLITNDVNKKGDSVSKFYDKHPSLTNYITEKGVRALFTIWDSMGTSDYNAMKLVGVNSEAEKYSENTAFRNIADVVWPLLAIEWAGGIENTKFAKMGYSKTNEMGFEYLKFKVEPINYDYLFDESEGFGEHGYACWDIRIVIDETSDLSLPVDSKFIDNDYLPFIQELFPESARNKLSSYRYYTQDQLELIEMLWEHYSDSIDFTHTFCRVEIVLTDESYF